MFAFLPWYLEILFSPYVMNLGGIGEGPLKTPIGTNRESNRLPTTGSHRKSLLLTLIWKTMGRGGGSRDQHQNDFTNGVNHG